MASPENKGDTHHNGPQLFSGMRNDHDFPGVISSDWQFDSETNTYIFTGEEEPIEIQPNRARGH